MKARIFQVDAFTTTRLAGNPAAVMLMDRFPADRTMQAVVDDNNLAETAFLVPDKGDYRLRWFTPKVEGRPIVAIGPKLTADFVGG